MDEPTTSRCCVCGEIADCRYSARIREIRALTRVEQQQRLEKLEAKEKARTIDWGEDDELLTLRAEFSPPISTDNMEL